jgi:hypothetical protein
MHHKCITRLPDEGRDSGGAMKGPFVHAESVGATSPIAADLTVVYLQGRSKLEGGAQQRTESLGRRCQRDVARRDRRDRSRQSPARDVEHDEPL